MADITTRHIPGFEDRYTVSVTGEIYSLVSQRKLRKSLSGGYFVVTLYDNLGKKYCGFVHRLVAYTYLGRVPGLEIRHLDGDKLNNSLPNLAWGTREENQQDRLRHGTHNRGERSGKAKLTAEKVLEIRRLLNTGKNDRQVAQEIGCSRKTVNSIKLGETWGWLSQI